MLALVMAVTSTGLTACNKTSDSSEWKAAENEWVSLGIDVVKSEGHYTVTLTHDSDVFGDKVSAENIKIEGIYLNETDAPQESTEPIYTRIISQRFRSSENRRRNRDYLWRNDWLYIDDRSRA